MSYTYVTRLDAKAIARAKGEKRYQGQSCPKGHDGMRLVINGACVDCARLRNETYRADPTHQKLARQRTRDWQRANPSKVNAATVLREQQKRKAWLPGHDEALREIYANTPRGYHVDHVVPLNHELVCGLHVPWNLQYLTAAENCSKKNRFDPNGYQGELGFV